LNSDQLIQLRKQKGISSLPWSPQELSVLSYLNVPQSLQGLVSATSIQRSEVRSILKVLSALGFIEVSNEVSSEKTSPLKNEPFPLQLLIPEIRHPALSDKLEVLENESSFVSEQFALLKVQIDGTGKDRPTQIVSVCSAYLKDGKSLIASNLALSYAQDPGRRVLLLDCDLRNPSIQKYFGIPLEPGIISYLKDERLEPYCYMRRVGSLYLMTAGGVTQNAVELLSHPRMLELMDYLRKEFDTVVVDSAPIDLVSDTRILFRLVDGLILVIRRAKSPYGAVKRTFKALDQSKFLGVVFNDVKPQLFHTYYNYGYYHYGYGQYPYHSGKGPKTEAKTQKGSAL
jgi:capsular exopolysaccharide synthesis family protein